MPKDAMAQVINLSEAEPTASRYDVLTAVTPLLAEQGPNIPALHEQLAIVVPRSIKLLLIALSHSTPGWLVLIIIKDI